MCHESTLKKLPRDVEADVPGGVVDAAASELAERRAEAVGEVDLKRVSAGARFQAERALVDARLVAADARRQLADEVSCRPDPDARAQPDHRRVVAERRVA